MLGRELEMDNQKLNEGRDREENREYYILQKVGHNLCKKDCDFTTNIKAEWKGDNGPF